MRFTSQEEYGLRCMIQLAKNEDEGPMPIEEIAKKEGLTSPYVGKLMRILLKGGLIRSIRGQSGGYALAKPAIQITLEEIIAVLDGKLFENKYCDKYSGMGDHCIHTSECTVRSLWSTLDAIITNILSQTMLKDLVVGEKALSEWFRYGERPNVPLPDLIKMLQGYSPHNTI